MSWIVRARPVSLARVSLFCFPYAGGSAAVFRSWQGQLDCVDVCAVQLPGRAGRLREKAYASLCELAEAVCDGLAAELDRPFALFGHSFGGLLAFEVARELVRRGGPEPEQLLVSSRRGPRRPERIPALHALPDADFVAAVRARYDAIPEAVLQEPALLELLLPALRADLQALETYVYQPETPLACPIAAFGGLDDPWATRDDLEAWRLETRTSFTLTRFPGGHFYFQRAEPLLLKALEARIGAGGELVDAQTKR